VVALMTTSCGTPVHAAGNSNSLYVYGKLPLGTVNKPYNATLEVTGGSSPYNWVVKSGNLPPGVILNSATGAISGRPLSPGIFQFEVAVSDSTWLAHGIEIFAVGVNGATLTGGVQIRVSPANTSLSSKSKQQFTATISGTSNTAVSWSATAGSVDASGLYTAPSVTSQTSATITATSNADPSKTASAVVTLNPATSQSLQITTGNLPQGAQGNPYSAAFAATGGTSPYSWSISAGTAPPGTSMDANGNLSGTPATTGSFSFTVLVADAANHTATGNSVVTVTQGGNFDGPAELPRQTVSSTMADTPAPGSVISVPAGGNLQAALNNVQCGETIQLQAGATFSGQFTVPAKNCDVNHWIIIRTSSPDSALPAEGQRATPCYAGVASLVGRPQYLCPNPSNVMAKVQNPIGAPLHLAPGASFYRFIGLEVTRPAGIRGSSDLILGDGSYDHVVVDRSWLHGSPQNETSGGVNLNQGTNVAVVDSYFTDFHCIAVTGTCIDAHAVSGGTSDTQDGPFKIQDNFLEASGESIMFGGGAATATPADIQISGNHFWKPWQWMKGNPNFVGGPDGHPFVVKNHIELKNAVRVLIEANLMENNWGGFSQAGYGILLTPKNQHVGVGTGSDSCPVCQVTDVTIRYVHLSHAASGISMVTSLSGNGNNGSPALAGARWSIHDVLIDDISMSFNGDGVIFEIGNSWPKNALNTVTIDHVTAFPDPAGHMLLLGNLAKNESMYGLVFTNNVMVTARYPVMNVGGGTTSCAYYDVPLTAIARCFSGYTFANNALVASPAAFPASSWPAYNMFPQTIADVAFMNFSGGDYQLQQDSPYKNKGMDNRDLGADIVGLNEALANVE